jgi:dTDP-4-amino-4,6-dideoxygalactose transaminase
VGPSVHLPRSAPVRSLTPARAPIRFQHPEMPPMDAVLAYFRMSEEAGWYSNGGPCSLELTRRLQERLGSGTHAVLVSNATMGLLAALRAACGAPTGARRLIVTTSYTFTATACAVEWAGFEPLFVDVDPEHWHLDPSQLEGALDAFGGEIAGVLACATFGVAPPPAVRAAWRALCDERRVPLVIDSAPGFGTVDAHGLPLGGLGDTEVFSFHATKPFAIGEGGMVATADADLAERMRRLANFGLAPGTRVSDEAGINAKLSELHAATGLAVLDRFDDVLAGRRRLAGALANATTGYGLQMQPGAFDGTWQFFQALAPTPAARTAALAAAQERAVEVRTLHDPPLHRHPAFARARRFGTLAVTDDLAARSLSLPLANTLPADAVEHIAEVAKAC